MGTGKTGGLLKIVIGVLGIILVITLFSSVLTSMVNLRAATASHSETTANLTTEELVEEADVILLYELYEGDVSNVTGFVTTIADEVPVAASYESSTKTLTVDNLTDNMTGWSAETTRDLTVTYKESAITDFIAFPTVTAIAPTVLFLGLIFGSGMLIYSGAKQYRK